jgi:hypothetical protein
MMSRAGRPRPLLAILTLLAGALAGRSDALAQCAMCGAAASSSSGLARGLAFSIFFLLGALIFAVGWLVVLVLNSQVRPRTSDAPPAAGRVPDRT